MAEKRVSVRLSATGGREVRAELEGVGEAGERGFGRLSSEMEAANARLARFAGKVKVALSVAATAAAGSLGLIVNSTIEASAEIRRFAEVANTAPETFQRWSAGARTVGFEQDKLADILKDVNDRVGDFLTTGGGPMKDFFEQVAPKVGVTADQFARLSGPEALQLYVDSLQKAGLGQQEMTFYLEAMASDATLLLPLLRDGGAEMERLGERAAGLGAVLDKDAIAAMQRTERAIGAVMLVLEGLRNRIAVAVAPVIEWLAERFVATASEGGTLRIAIDAVFSSLDRLATYAATFAGFLAGRWVVGMAAAVFSVRGLATALVILRGALIRTGIGALIVGAGELIFQFGKLQKGAGGVGNALSLMGDVAREVWDRLRRGAGAAGAAIAALFLDIKADAASGMQGAIQSVTAFANAAVNSFEGAYEAIKAIWGLLPAAIGDLTIQAANALVAGMEAMLNGALGALNSLLSGINEGFEALGFERRIAIIPDIDVGRIENSFAGAATRAAGAAGDAFARAFADNPLDAPDLGLRRIGTDALAAANDYRDLAASLADGLRAPLSSWRALKDAVAAGSDEGADALDSATNGAARLETAFAAAGDAAAGAAEETREIDRALADATARAAAAPITKATPLPRPKPVPVPVQQERAEPVTRPDLLPLVPPPPDRSVRDDRVAIPSIAVPPRTRRSAPVLTPPPILDRAPPAITESADALEMATDVTRRFETALGQAGTAATRTGAATETAATASGTALETTATGWRAVGASLEDYAAKAADLGGAIGQRLVDAFRSAEDAVADFVRTGKLDFRDLVSSLITDLARLATRRFILGPIANALGGVLGGIGGGAGGGAGAGLGSLFASILHAGGTVGGSAPMRAVPALTFAGAPRLHDGGRVGLAPDEVPAILQRGERVLSRRETRDYERRSEAPMQVTVNINAQDAESFRRSRTQVASDIARAIQLGRRGM